MRVHAVVDVGRGAGDCASAPFGAEVVLGGVQDCNQDPHYAFGGGAVGVGGIGGFGVAVGAVVAAGEEGAGEVADGGDDFGEVVASFPEAVVRRLVAEDLGW